MLVLLAVGVVALGRVTDAEVRTVSECVQLAPACDGERVTLGYLRVRRVSPAGIEVAHSGHTLLLRGVGDPVRPGKDEISVEATWRPGAVLDVHRTMLHRHRRWKRYAGLVGLVGWMVWLGRRRG